MPATFTPSEIETIMDALNMALASNKRMQTNKPKFYAVFKNIEDELISIRQRIPSLMHADLTDNKNITPVTKR